MRRACITGLVGAWGVLVPCAARPVEVLVFTRTEQFRHDSIPAAVQAIAELGAANCFNVTHTEDPTAFTPANLARFDVVAFVLTSGDVLDAAQQSAFEGFIGAGGGFVGVHSAADTEYDWVFYDELLGTHFLNHPVVQQATVRIEDGSHPSTRGLPNPWVRVDEWYNFRTNPRPRVHVLATLDETTYQGGMMGADHPIAWCREYAGGRSWYTAGGHSSFNYTEPAFRGHLLGGILWAAGLGGACRADFDGSCAVDSADFFAFLVAFFNGEAAADFNGDGAIGSQDFFDFLAAFFAGC